MAIINGTVEATAFLVTAFLWSARLWPMFLTPTGPQAATGCSVARATTSTTSIRSTTWCSRAAGNGTDTVVSRVDSYTLG